MPSLAFSRRNTARVQIGRNRGQRLGARCARGVDVIFDGGGVGDGLAVMPGGDTRAIQSQLDATGLCGCEGGLGPLRNHLAFVLGEGGHDVQNQPAGMGHIDGHKIRRALHQVGDEGDVAGETIQFGDQQGRLVPAARLQGERELRSVVLGAGLDLDELGDDLSPGALAKGDATGCSARGEELIDRFALRVEAKAAQVRG
jgi:hypothetical protein